MSILVATLSLLSILILLTPEGFAQIYKYVDKEGVIRFTDTPSDPAFKRQKDPQLKDAASPADLTSRDNSVTEDKTTAQQKAISELQRQDKIRLATASDVASWKGEEEEEKERLLSDRKHGTVFVVLKEITLPSGLYGAHRRDFIIPENVPKPYGDKGHCRFYYLKDNTFE